MSKLSECIENGDFGANLGAALAEALPKIEDRAAFVNQVIGTLLPMDHKAQFWGDRMLTLDKSAGFLDAPDFAAAFHAIVGQHPYDQYGGTQTIAWRLHTLVWAARQALVLPAGDFVECGVFKGDMAWQIATLTGFADLPRRFVLFDSFHGLDTSLVKSDDYPDNPGYVEFSNQYYQQTGLYEQVKARFAPWDNIEIVRGYLPGALDSGSTPARIAFLHVDLNSPAAELGCFERLFTHLVPGAVIVLDDYGWRSFRMQKLAADHFFGQRGLQVLELPTGQGLVIVR